MSLIQTLRKMNVESPFRYELRILLTYHDVVRTHVPFIYKIWIGICRKKTLKGTRRLKGKNKIDVAFIVSVPGMWKYDYVFEEMQQNPKYHPYVVIIPYTVYKGYSSEEIVRTIRQTESFVKQRGFEYTIPFDEQKHCWLDIKKTLNPDIVFFTCPYKDMERKYHAYHFRDRLTCYSAYSFTSMKLYKNNYDKLALNICGCFFQETSMHKHFAEIYGTAKGVNSVVVGYLGGEVYLRGDGAENDVWRYQDHPKKRIIWAPHHSIDGTFSISTFLNVCDLMVSLAEEYKDVIQFAFKPHQLLKFKLIEIWGKEKTDAYYKKWDEMSNCQLEEGEYASLFMGSDAMIHDCGGFTSEYLYQKKPVLYLVKNNNPEDTFNDFGIESFRQHYVGRNESDVRDFIEDVVIGGNDPMSEGRQIFYDKYLGPVNGELPSTNVIRTIESLINK